MTASRLACDLVRVASVAPTTSVYFSRRPPLVLRAIAASGNDGAIPRPPNSPSRSNGAAQNQGPSPTTTEPTALTTASAPTVVPSGTCAEAEPNPPLRLTVVHPRPARPLPSAKFSPAAAAAA